MVKTIGVAGLGLIGGCMAKTIKAKTDCRIYGLEIRGEICQTALAENVIDAVLTKDNMADCDLLIVALYPGACISFVKEYIPFMRKGCIIVDCGGIKTDVCESLSSYCNENGVFFIGGHPMAGIEKSGYEYSFVGLFDNATMILCKDEYTDAIAFETMKKFFRDLGFGAIRETDYKEHDEVIAFTSQMAHLVSSAYIKSPTCESRYGFSAGSFKDLTRVAYLNEDMWTELFLKNREPLLKEVNLFIDEVIKYRDALEKGDRDGLHNLLKEGRIKKDADNRKEVAYGADSSGGNKHKKL